MSKLKTVGDYKKAGLVFVEGDCTTYDGSGNDRIEMRELGVLNMNSGYNNSWDIVEFAWRNNTGEKPEFNSKMEVVCSGGDVIMVKSATAVNWEAIDYYLKWRPHLPQSNTETPEEKEAFERIEKKSTYDVDAHVSGEHKPVFTQEMADRGELPPVGSVAAFRYKFDSKRVMHEGVISYASPAHCIFIKSSCPVDNIKEIHLNMCDYTYEPTKTDREKAIDEIKGEWPKACEHTIKLMHDLGYRKESK